MLKKLTTHLIVGATFMAVSGLGGALAAQVTEIAGAGATFPYPIYAKWAEAYNQKTGVKLNYQSIGSGGGIKQIKAKTVDFGASDAPLTNTELDEAGLMQFPMIIGGVVPVVNIPGIKAGEIKLSPTILAEIYLGKIAKWDDKAIADLNKGVNLPATAISVVHRSDGSGTTWIFTNYLTKVSKDWADKVGNDKAVAWPVGVGGKGNEGVSAYVQRIQGSIGYVEYAYILENKLSYTRMINSAGKVVSPSLKGFQAAASHVDFTKAKDFYVILTDQPGDDTWPISGCTWQILRKDAPKATNENVTKFFDWGFEKGQKMATDIAFGPLPPSTVAAIKTYWKANLGI